MFAMYGANIGAMSVWKEVAIRYSSCGSGAIADPHHCCNCDQVNAACHLGVLRDPAAQARAADDAGHAHEGADAADGGGGERQRIVERAEADADQQVVE